jgi:hypothetical protein
MGMIRALFDGFCLKRDVWSGRWRIPKLAHSVRNMQYKSAFLLSYRCQLWNSPAGHNELHKLELRGA